MAIAGVSSSTGSTTIVQPEGAVGKKDLGKGDFMTLFITQLQYQDPMKPMESNEMASQLAQFSNMEATLKMSDNMQSLLDYQTSQSNLQLLTMLGKDVLSEGNSMAVTAGKVNPTEFVLDDPASTIDVTVYDAANRPVWTKSVGNEGAGTYKVEWDGKSSSGTPVEDGSYHYEVKAMSTSGEALPVTYHSSGKVTGVNFTNGVVGLEIDKNVLVKVSDIIQVQ